MIMRRLFLISSVLLCLASFTSIDMLAQEYVATPVTISKEKVRSNGKLYYSHVVLERQTLFSIAKTYGVTIQEIYDANPSMDIEQQGLKKDEIILIPYKSPEEIQAQENQVQTSEPQEAICFLCSFIGHKLGEICVPNIHKKLDCIRLACYKHIYTYLRKERKVMEQEDIDNCIIKVDKDCLQEPEDYIRVKKI